MESESLFRGWPVVFFTDTSPLMSEELFGEGLSRVPRERRERIERIRFRKDKNLSLGAGLLLQMACEARGIPGAAEELLLGEHGKPAFRGQPDIFFNLSHSGSIALCAIGGSPLGCDAERIQEKTARYAGRLMTPGEYGDFCMEAEEDRLRHFFRLWTGKESLMKCTGKGFSLPPGAFTLRVDKDGIRLQEPIDEYSYSFFEYFGEPDYAMTLCLRDYVGVAPEWKRTDLREVLR